MASEATESIERRMATAHGVGGQHPKGRDLRYRGRLPARPGRGRGGEVAGVVSWSITRVCSVWLLRYRCLYQK